LLILLHPAHTPELVASVLNRAETKISRPFYVGIGLYWKQIKTHQEHPAQRFNVQVQDNTVQYNPSRGLKKICIEKHSDDEIQEVNF
jgi:hypothetical protein